VRGRYHEQLAGLTSQLAIACERAGRAMRAATDALLDADVSAAEQALLDHDDIVVLTRHVEHSAFTILALQAPVASELRDVVGSVQIAADVERMGGLAAHVARLARLRHPHRAVPADVGPQLADMGRLAVELADGARRVLVSRDPGQAAQLRHDDDAMDEMHGQLLLTLMDRQWRHDVQCAVDVALLGRFYERFADHAVQIGRRVIFQATGLTDPWLGPGVAAPVPKRG
jgi:phosphate transport system protein